MILESDKTYYLHKLKYELNSKNISNVLNLFEAEEKDAEGKELSLDKQLREIEGFGEGIVVFIDKVEESVKYCYVVTSTNLFKSDNLIIFIIKLKIKLFFKNFLSLPVAIRGILASFLSSIASLFRSILFFF